MAKESSVTTKNVEKQIAQLGRMNIATLRATYKRVVGKDTASRNRAYIQAQLTARLRERAGVPLKEPRPYDARVPPAGTVLEREHDGATHKVTVTDDGFRYDGKSYGSLSTVAKVITGKIWNGFVFFGRALKEAQS
jgi:Protein of unknown function (DUF2924)